MVSYHYNDSPHKSRVTRPLGFDYHSGGDIRRLHWTLELAYWLTLTSSYYGTCWVPWPGAAARAIPAAVVLAASSTGLRVWRRVINAFHLCGAQGHVVLCS